MYSVEIPKLIEKPGRTGVLRKKRRDWVTIGTMSWLDKAAQGCGRKANDHHEDGRLKEWHCKPRLCTCQSRSHAVPPAAASAALREQLVQHAAAAEVLVLDRVPGAQHLVRVDQAHLGVA